MRDWSARRISGVGSESKYVFQGGQPRLDRGLVRRFRVDAHQRLGATRTQQHPAAVREIELESVVRADPLDLDARDLRGFMRFHRAQYPNPVLLVGLTVEVDVVPRIRVWADPLLQAGEDLRERPAELDDHVREQQPDENPIALGNMASDRESTRLLTAEHRVGLHHLRRHVLEPNRTLVVLDPELGVQLVCRRRDLPALLYLAG